MTSNGTCTILRLKGPGYLSGECDEARALLLEHIACGDVRLVVDLSYVELAGTNMLGILVYAYSAAAKAGGDLKLCGVRKPLRITMELLRLHRVFDIHETAESATESFT